MTASAPEHFQGPRELLSWGREDAAEIKRRWDAFQATNPFRILRYIDRTTGDDACKIRMTSPLPEGLDKLTHNAGNAVRHSFDQAMFAVVKMIDPAWQGDVYFPWSTGPADLDGKLKRSPVPEEVKEILRSFQPYNTGVEYAGGDNILRNFAKAVSPAKHRLAVAASLNLRPEWIDFDVVAGEVLDVRLSIVKDLRITGKGDYPFVTISGDRPDRKYKFKVALGVTYGDGSILSGQPVFETISHAAARAEHIINRLEDWASNHSAP